MVGLEVKSLGLRMEDSRREGEDKRRYGGYLYLFAIKEHPLGLPHRVKALPPQISRQDANSCDLSAVVP